MSSETVGGSASRQRKWRDQTRLVLVCAVVVLGTLFAVLNTQTVTIHWVFTTTDSPLIVAMVIMALLGFIGGLAVGHFRQRRGR